MGDGILLYRGPLFLEGIAFHGVLLLSFLLTLNRAAAFFFPDVNERMFSRKGTILILLPVLLRKQDFQAVLLRSCKFRSTHSKLTVDFARCKSQSFNREGPFVLAFALTYLTLIGCTPEG
ncbi:hypothetical protein ANCCAN_01515 [Ancylostoma caninum]|uniref:Uncharacterized protein n=1 Tax=Ancylostoma caninum TaxID=29170 RepID=A0A368H784_ANCCA|nr:hypothetical protein ANCCAN_01515 [Ancylostoma caninum]